MRASGTTRVARCQRYPPRCSPGLRCRAAHPTLLQPGPEVLLLVVLQVALLPLSTACRDRRAAIRERVAGEGGARLRPSPAKPPTPEPLGVAGTGSEGAGVSDLACKAMTHRNTTPATNVW